MSEELVEALDELLENGDERKRAIVIDMLWKATRGDWHGVSDCANDLRELGL